MSSIVRTRKKIRCPGCGSYATRRTKQRKTYREMTCTACAQAFTAKDTPDAFTYYLKYKDATGRTQRESLAKHGIHTRAAATELLRDYQAKERIAIARAAGQALDDDLEWPDLLHRYERDNAGSIKPATRTLYISTFRKFADILPNVTLRTLKKSHLLHYRDALKREGKANTTINSYVKQIKVILNYGHRELDDPDNMKNARPLRTVARRRRSLDREQVTALIQAAQADSTDAHRMVALAYYAMMRTAEIAAAHTDWIDWTHNLIVIESDEDATTEAGAYSEKRNRIRITPMHPALRQILEHERGAHRHLIRPGHTGRPDQRYRVDLRDTWERIRTDAGVPEATLKKLRATAFTVLDAAGVDRRKTASWGGNSPAVAGKHYIDTRGDDPQITLL